MEIVASHSDYLIKPTPVKKLIMGFIQLFIYTVYTEKSRKKSLTKYQCVFYYHDLVITLLHYFVVVLYKPMTVADLEFSKAKR